MLCYYMTKEILTFKKKSGMPNEFAETEMYQFLEMITLVYGVDFIIWN